MLPWLSRAQSPRETGILAADIMYIFRSLVSALRTLARVFRYRYRSRVQILNLAPVG